MTILRQWLLRAALLASNRATFISSLRQACRASAPFGATTLCASQKPRRKRWAVASPLPSTSARTHRRCSPHGPPIIPMTLPSTATIQGSTRRAPSGSLGSAKNCGAAMEDSKCAPILRTAGARSWEGSPLRWPAEPPALTILLLRLRCPLWAILLSRG